MTRLDCCMLLLAIISFVHPCFTSNEIVEYPLPTLDATIDIKKLEHQSETLRRSLAALQNSHDGIDVAFLVDSSLSVGLANFESELRFVKKILADFSVSHLRKNAARVILVTFSSSDKVVTHIDFISPNGSVQTSSRHKCSLMAELTRIQYVGGLTYTLGAMKVADEVLKASDRSVPQVVFLITDGFSNGGDPKPIARKLKSRGVTIFAFGIKNGNVKELQDMATSHKEHCFIVNSFEEFEALARRALHQDLSVGDFEPLDLSQCNGLCPSGQQCCHQGAQCACGTTSGYFTCLCPRGQYGTGLKGECRQRKCQELSAPKNGWIKCTTKSYQFETECAFGCNEGFVLVGSKRRNCLAVAHWDGLPATCRHTEPPSIECPDNILVPTDPGEPYATVDFSLPSTQDNSGFRKITLTVAPAVEPPFPFFIGEANITYTATDLQGNRNSCAFTVTVIDEEPPTVDRCESPGVTISSDGQGAKVVWEEPLFSDNSNEDVFIWSSHKPGQYFLINDTTVTYFATDNSGNNASCTFNITIKANKCELSYSVRNGKFNCSTGAMGTFCRIQCDVGFILLPGLPDHLRCIDGIWNAADRDLPSCAPVVAASKIGNDSMPTPSGPELPAGGTMFECTDEFLAQQLSVTLKKRVSIKNVLKCKAKPKCRQEKLTTICEAARRNRES
ncbi:sushi [Tropilaelaps mercedesae]|uniref:Sushi n=1 Tax=Tropilaelaps mercedesae TaxID=418985 RepID=A0A1V9XK45_9ACAR|nr:sushi [Tropilaelaps mercedesae]